VAPDGRHAEAWYRLGMAADYLEKLDFPISDGTEPDTSLIGRALRHGRRSTISTDLTQSGAAGHRPGSSCSSWVPFSGGAAAHCGRGPDWRVSLASRESDLLSDEELRLLQDITANLSFALQYRQKETAVQYLAYYDPLNGTSAKRGLFCERLDKLLQNSCRARSRAQR